MKDERVGALGDQPTEVAGAVEDGCSRRQDDARSAQGALGGVDDGFAQAGAGDPDSLDQSAAAVGEGPAQALEELHGVDLELALEPDLAGGLEGELVLVGPRHGQVHGSGG